MATQQLPPQSPLEERLRQLEEQLKALTTAPASSPVSSFLERWLPGITLVTIIGFAFWLGGISNKIDANTTKVDKLIEWKDTASARLSVIETKIDNNASKLDSIDKRLEGMASDLSRAGRR